MARNNAGTLAGLAALAGAAYLNRDKLFGSKDETPKGKEDTGPGYQSTETRLKTPAQSIAEADKSDKSSSISTKGESGTTTPGPDKSAPDLSESRNKPAPKPAAKPASASAPKTPAADNTTAAAIPSGIMGGKRQPTNTVSSSAEGMKNYKPRRTPPPPPFKGGQPGYDEAGRFLGGKRGYDEAGNPMKKGGAVKKMASGGMTASKRADGIASKGKTKCRMY